MARFKTFVPPLASFPVNVKLCSALPPFCAALNLLRWVISWTGMCRGSWAKLSWHVAAAPTDRWLELDQEESSGSLFVLLHLYDLIKQLQWIRAKRKLSLFNIPIMTIQTGTRTMQSLQNHPKSEYKKVESKVSNGAISIDYLHRLGPGTSTRSEKCWDVVVWLVLGLLCTFFNDVFILHFSFVTELFYHVTLQQMTSSSIYAYYRYQ